jgi:arylsulfatase A-like enzyme
MRCKATDKDDTTDEPHWGRVGKQSCEDTGPLTPKRMETIDDETTAAAIDFMNREAKSGKPFFVWMNTTRMHVFTTHSAIDARAERNARERVCRRND